MQRPIPAQASPAPPSYIKPISPFSPRDRQCCQCNKTASDQSRCSDGGCNHQLCHGCPRRDARGIDLIPHSFPVNWICSTCNCEHSVLEILTMDVKCKCDNPTLQAIYDQFGRIFLYWRDDPAVYDLKDPVKLQEAAYRVWEAGSEPWLPAVLEAEKLSIKRRNRGSSQSSASSRDSLDDELAGL